MIPSADAALLVENLSLICDMDRDTRRFVGQLLLDVVIFFPAGNKIDNLTKGLSSGSCYLTIKHFMVLFL